MLMIVNCIVNLMGLMQSISMPQIDVQSKVSLDFILIIIRKICHKRFGSPLSKLFSTEYMLTLGCMKIDYSLDTKSRKLTYIPFGNMVKLSLYSCLVRPKEWCLRVKPIVLVMVS